MNWKSTVALVILAAVAGVWLWKGDAWAPSTAPKSAPPDPTALAQLEDDLKPETLTRIEVAPPGGDVLVPRGDLVDEAQVVEADAGDLHLAEHRREQAAQAMLEQRN